MKKKGIYFIIIVSALYWGYVYFFGVNRSKAEGSAKKAVKSSVVTGLHRANISLMQSTINDFHAHTGRYPRQLSELVSVGFMVQLPYGSWDYDPETGEIK